MTSAAIAAAGAVSAGLSGAHQSFGADGQPLHGSLATLVSIDSVFGLHVDAMMGCTIPVSNTPERPCMMACSAGVELVLLQGAQAHAAGVLFPSDDDTLHRTILIANINPLVNTEQVGFK